MMREWTAAGTAGRLITADPRRVCFRNLASCAQIEWTRSETQSLFSSPDVDGRALWKLVRTCLPRLCGHVSSPILRIGTARWTVAPQNADASIATPCSPQCMSSAALFTLVADKMLRKMSESSLHRTLMHLQSAIAGWPTMTVMYARFSCDSAWPAVRHRAWRLLPPPSVQIPLSSVLSAGTFQSSTSDFWTEFVRRSSCGRRGRGSWPLTKLN